VPVLGPAPFGLGAVELPGEVELAGVAELGVPTVVDGREALSGPDARLGDGEPVCPVCDVGVHATSAATTNEAAAARRRGCERYIKPAPVQR
jgi:hypothetical protein